MRAVEQSAFVRGATPERLMDQAGAGIARAVSDRFPEAGRCLAFAGKGHNGGDALVAAKHLRELNWTVDVRLPFAEAACAELTQRKLGSLRDVPEKCGQRRRHTVVLDGLLGIGSQAPLREPIRAACREINEWRQSANATVFAIDVPTGLDADSGQADRDCVVAEVTVTIGFAKAGLLADEAINFVGRLEVISLEDLEPSGLTNERTVASHAALRSLLPRRGFGAYKNQFGRVGIVAGSKGLTGAAVLCTLGALRGGAGLVHLFVPQEIYSVVAAASPPEAMIRPIRSYAALQDEPIDVWAVGPGLGRDDTAQILGFIAGTAPPMVIDADGLNAIADDIGVLERCHGPRLLTPHPGEMERLDPGGDHDRAARVRAFTVRHKATLLLKGSRTIVAERNAPISYNTTGHPAMATGGIGDVTTGLCAALIAQHLSPYDAARMAAWIAGRAAEIALFRGTESEQSLIARDMVDHLGAAFSDLQSAVD